MTFPRGFDIKASFVLGIACLFVGAECSPLGVRRGLAGAETVFDVTTYGAIANSPRESALAIIRAWNAACQSTGPAKLVIPPGNFSVGELVLQGPCTASKPLVIEIQGTLLSRTDLSLYTRNIWITIEKVDGVVVTGGGTLNGQGEASYKYGGSESNLLPASLVMSGVTNSRMENLNVVNSKGFHTKVTSCTNVTVTNMTITAPGDSPNTDGLHISRSKDVTVTNSVIGTGDDCISIGEGNTNINVLGITCGPGHGISVGSLGKRPDETSVNGVTVKNCTLTGTTNGARIKSYHASPQLDAKGIIFEDIVMNDVKNPIIIDQHYNSKNEAEPSNVKISDVHFKNIRGTSISPVAIALNCSSKFPCETVELAEINLTPASNISGSISSACENVKPLLTGTLNPAGCQ